MTTDHDPDSDAARLARHRDACRTVHPDVLAARRREAEATALTHAFALVTQQRTEAIQHLQALLNTQRTATQALEAERAAREWLESVSSEPGATDPITSYYTDRANGVHAAKAP